MQGRIMPHEESAILSLTKKATMGDMLSMILHQWKQPLSIISILNTSMDFQLECDKFDKERFLAYNTKIKEQIDYMSETMYDFKDFLLEDKEKRIINIKTCIERAIKFTTIALKKNEIEYTMNYHTLKSEIWGFNNDISQILIIFILNAKDKLSLLSIDTKKITIDVEEDNENLLICVKDNGGLIDEAILDMIFDESFTTKDEKNGNGLGLYIARRIAKERLNGQIFVENNEEENSVIFTLSIPCSE